MSKSDGLSVLVGKEKFNDNVIEDEKIFED